jgi:hypothetical protein
VSASQRRKGQRGEVWAPYPPCPTYEISTHGRARSTDRRALSRWGATRLVRGRVLALAKSPQGYLFFGLCDGASQKPCYVHRAVLLAFVGEPGDGEEACHQNGDKQDNRLENLRWDSRKANHADKFLHGTAQIGESNGSAKLTAANVQSIRGDKRTLREIAVEFGISVSTASRVRRGDTWRHFV